MTITIACPNCGKKYSLKESVVGKKAKCTCGCVFRISNARGTAEEQTTKPRSDAFESYPKEELGQKSLSKPIDSGLSKQPKSISEEKSMAKVILNRLAYGSPGIIIVTAYIYYKEGFYDALFGMLFGTIGFCIVMYKIASVARKKAAEQGISSEQYRRKWWAAHKATTPKLRFTMWVFYGSCILLLGRFIIPEEWAAKVWPDLAFAKHWRAGLLILVLNFPVLLLVAEWMMGGWRKYLKIAMRLFLWGLLPFHYFFKGYWETFTKMSREELFGLAATDMLYIWICLLEYMIIKAVFLS